jgi:hypothetical protein
MGVGFGRESKRKDGSYDARGGMPHAGGIMPAAAYSVEQYRPYSTFTNTFPISA